MSNQGNLATMSLFMKLTIVLLALVLSANAQSVIDNPAPPSKTTTDKKEADAKLHENVVRLVELVVPKQRLRDNFRQLLEVGRKQMMDACAACAPEFGDEWVKRMSARLKVDDFIDVHVRVYEKYFDNDDIAVLLAIQSALQKGQVLTPSPKLKHKLDEILPSLMSEIAGGCTQLGVKLGSEVGGEIQKEHPEYFKENGEPGK